MYGIIVHENLRFGSSKREREAGVFKNLTSGTPRFKNLPFFGARKCRLLADGRL